MFSVFLNPVNAGHVWVHPLGMGNLPEFIATNKMIVFLLSLAAVKQLPKGPQLKYDVGRSSLHTGIFHEFDLLLDIKNPRT